MPRDSRAFQRSLLIDEPSVAVAATNRNKEGRIVDIGSVRQTIAFVGGYLPRKSGLATFTSDLLEAVASADPPSRCFAAPVTDIEGAYRYPDVVRYEIQEQDPLSYLHAADFLNATGVDVVSLQHEFGMFGGPAGSHLLTLLRNVRAPVVTTLHTVLASPNEDQRSVMLELVERSKRLVVMTERGRGILQEVYRAPANRIDVIAHGIPDVPFLSPDRYKERLGLGGRKVMLTFGLLSPNKGIEYAMRALPELVAEFPDLLYIVLGATHPDELRTRGDGYRFCLEALVNEHKLDDNVIFDNRFVESKELTEFIGAADIFVTPYLDEARSTSGTLAHAFGAGKAIVSTPYWHAAELLRYQRGVLVPFADSKAIAHEVRRLLRNDTRRDALRAHVYALGRDMVWAKTAAMYKLSFDRARRGGSADGLGTAAARGLAEVRPSSVLGLNHLHRMTDSTGIVRPASTALPTLAEGYYTEDNARALTLSVLLGQLVEPSDRVWTLGRVYAAFLTYAFDEKTERFRDFLRVDGLWLDQPGSEESHGRALWALGTAVGRAPLWSSQMMFEHLFGQALQGVKKFTSPQACAFSLIGIREYLRRLNRDRMVEAEGEELTARLMTGFKQGADPGDPWLEWGPNSASLAHALIAGGRATGQGRAFERGIQSLRGLIAMQPARGGSSWSSGSNIYPAARTEIDKRTVEAQHTVSACLEAYRSTADPWWRQQAQRVFDGLLRWSPAGQEIVSHPVGEAESGAGGGDGRGSEPALAFLHSLAEIRLLQKAEGYSEGADWAHPMGP